MQFLQLYFLIKRVYSSIYATKNYPLKKVNLYSVANSENYSFYGSRFYSKNSNKIVTSETINRVVANQNVSITKEQLDQLLSIKGVTFNLPPKQ